MMLFTWRIGDGSTSYYKEVAAVEETQHGLREWSADDVV